VSDSIIRIENLCKRYATTDAVKGITFDVPRGACFGLLGPNGAGKSTLIKMIYGAISRTSGKISVLGFDPQRDYHKLRRKLGVVTQDNSLDDEMTVEENMLLFAGLHRLEKVAAKKRVGELLEFMGLAHKAKERIQDLSGGMKRRLVFVRALLVQPELLILDEPTTGLDPAVRHLIWDKIESLKATGTTILLTTHYLEEAQHLCDELVIVDQGTIKSSGSPKKLIADQNVGYVALFKKDSSVTRLEKPTLEALTQAIQALDDAPTLIRPANLEDVFLKITGRELSDDA